MNHCKDCPFKTECIMGNSYKTPIEERQKVLYVSKIMKQKRLETLERNTSDYGTQQRMKRSIQTEESFASHKRRYGFLPLFSPLFLKFPPRFPLMLVPGSDQPRNGLQHDFQKQIILVHGLKHCAVIHHLHELNPPLCS